ncbi:MAG: beta-ketoacyl synthase N-terminal-like domain-containing protein, partial [Gammaproteobacteria bacterium]
MKKVLGQSQAIDENKGFFEMGMDSLMSLELKNRLQSLVGKSLSNTLTFDYPTTDTLITYLASVLKIKELPQIKSTIQYISPSEPVAVIGMGCRFPGGANSPDEFWQLLEQGFDSSIEIPKNRWDADKYAGLISSRKSSFITTPIDEFDALFFGISPREAEYLDPQQRLLLETTWEALENASILPISLRDSFTGVFVGICSNDYGDLLKKYLRDEDIDAYVETGNTASTATGRISYTLGLKGPSLAIDTACSSSLVALHQGCLSLRNGESDMVIAGGVNALLSPQLSIDFSQANMLATDGHCKTFDKDADGYVRGEGCGIIILKRLSDAQRDNDRILAIIKGSAVNQDGASSGLTVPNGPAQEAVIQRALQQAKLKPEDIDYIEAHGTGTSLGDPIEINAISQVFKDRSNPLTIGTVKTNIGHLEAAAGIAGVIKTILSMQHEKIPKHLHFKELNPSIHLEEIPAQLPLNAMDWKKQKNRIRRAGISSFGFSGTNAHVILEEAPAQDARQWRPDLNKTVFNRKRYWAKALSENISESTPTLENKIDLLPSMQIAAMTQNQILNQVRAQVLTVLSLPIEETQYDEKGFFELGMDSLMAAELGQRIQKIFLDIKFDSTVAFDYPTIVKVSEYIEMQATGGKPKPSIQLIQYHAEPIAVIGMSCRFPGGANSTEEFWQRLEQGFDAASDIPKTRWDMDEYNAAGEKIYVRKAGLLNVPIEMFDASFFGLSPREAVALDPQQRLLLEVCWEALEDANIAPRSLQESLTGVFIGIYSTDYHDVLNKCSLDDSLMTYLGTGNAGSTATGRISYTLGLKGPSFAVDTACSSSLVALHQACISLREGESDLAITGGVNVILSPDAMALECSMQMLSPEGMCKTFDKDADGFMRGEGCGIIILKRLSDAQRDNDKILAVIKGSSVNQDGASSGLTVPNGPSQEVVIQRALQQAKLNPDDIDYIEAHGTGTSLGDPIEVNAISHVFKDRTTPLTIGTVKTNIGHLEAAAGIAGIIKTILSLQHEKIPPHLHFKTLNPAIHLEEIPVQIPLQALEWKKQSDRIRRAGVSSFGFSGTNAHVILEEVSVQDENELRAVLPKTVFNRQRYWPDALTNKERMNVLSAEVHPLLGIHFLPIANEERNIFQCDVDINESRLSYLKDHQIYGQTLFPAAAYVELMLAAMHLHHNEPGLQAIELKDLAIYLPLELNQENKTPLQVIMTPGGKEQYIKIYAQKADKEFVEWPLYAQASGHLIANLAPGEKSSINAMKARCDRSINVAELYNKLSHQGLQYGPAFQLLAEVQCNENEVIACIANPGLIDNRYQVYPALLDSCFHAATCLLQHQGGSVYLPLSFDSVALYQPITKECYVYVQLIPMNNNTPADMVGFDFEILNLSGEVLAKILGFKAKKVSQTELLNLLGKSEDIQEWCYTTVWQAYEPSAVEEILSPIFSVTYDARIDGDAAINADSAVRLLMFIQDLIQNHPETNQVNIITEQAYSLKNEDIHLK